jgi:hypothetical protein
VRAEKAVLEFKNKTGNSARLSELLYGIAVAAAACCNCYQLATRLPFLHSLARDAEVLRDLFCRWCTTMLIDKAALRFNAANERWCQWLCSFQVIRQFSRRKRSGQNCQRLFGSPSRLSSQTKQIYIRRRIIIRNSGTEQFGFFVCDTYTAMRNTGSSLRPICLWFYLCASVFIGG